MKTKTLVEHIASACAARQRCLLRGGMEIAAERWDQLLDGIEKDFLPHGSGIDQGCRINREKSDGQRVTVTFAFHHMDENGSYCGWSDYRLTVRPTFETGFTITLTGQDRNGLKDYLCETFSFMLSAEYEHTAENTLQKPAA